MSGQSPAPPIARVLVVDDEGSIRTSVQGFLRDAGYQVEIAEDTQSARELLAAGDYDVVLSDIVLPGGSGVVLLKAIRDASPDVQVIMMTGEPNVETASEAVRAGASDYLAKPVSQVAILAAVRRAAQAKRMLDENRRLQEENRRYQDDLEQMVARRTSELNEALEGTIHAMSLVVESRDPYTAGHQQRVAELARAIAGKMGLTGEVIQTVYFAGVIHDLGKLSVPAEILSRPSKLTAAEFELIKVHPVSGYEILKTVAFPWPIAEAVLQHHERLDGSGYPRGLSGDEVLPVARILSVADVVEAMASHRPYRPARGLEAALAEVTGKRGELYAPDVVDACVRLFREEGYEFEALDVHSQGAGT